jgi:hypothetical protein
VNWEIRELGDQGDHFYVVWRLFGGEGLFEKFVVAVVGFDNGGERGRLQGPGRRPTNFIFASKP